MRPHVCVTAFLFASPAFAQDGPSFDCSKAGSDAERLVCADADLARLDRQLSDRFAAAIDVARGLEVGAQTAEDEIRATQRGWISGRDECWKADDLRSCMADAYLRREGDLVARWMLEDPTGTSFWACGGNPANEVATTFFDTELPSVRFERGDSITTGFLSSTASGARYDADFGRYIWIKGEEAEYRDPDPDGALYSCVLAGSN
ncbi:MliC family protein [Marivita sp. XM-24bin2]|jgi:uncharacterized protein YecT (DUF1311 family)/membrane-bound inhibitor of C-type lysozyme|uniref:MliC family protein n=1 Tax=unclassified Marivita TaxID=2632480 RepID=UPI0025C27390|nr:MliC family protein [Marivita sp. XM-24bin2]MCR9109863.1 MliC family protein [Paracoccaceae bacterium]